MNDSPWAKCGMFMTPKISANPTDIKAHMPPVTRVVIKLRRAALDGDQYEDHQRDHPDDNCRRVAAASRLDGLPHLRQADTATAHDSSSLDDCCLVA